jgi:putative transposase
MEAEFEDKVKKKTLSIFLNKNKSFNDLFKFMSNISRNIYNITIYINSIYYKYKNEILKESYAEYLFLKLSDEQFYEVVYDKFNYFYKLHSDKNSLININNNLIYKKICEKLQTVSINNENYYKIRSEIYFDNLFEIKFNNEYEYDFIIDGILMSIYRKNFNLISEQIKNKIPIDNHNYDLNFINDVKQNKNLFPTTKSFKEKIVLKKDILSDQNIITRFIYKNLGENYNKLPSDIICNIIKKTFDNFKGYWACKEKGKKCNRCKFLNKDELFILPFFARSFVINKTSNSLRLTVGKHIANNLIEITKNENLICVNKDETTDYKKYINKELLKKIPEKIKLSKKNNYILDDSYIEKTNSNIINGYYVFFELPNKIKNENIKFIEISPIYKGHQFKLNISYDIKEKIEDVEIKKIKFTQSEAISMDFGMRNLITIYDPTGYQIIIKGNYLLALNHYYGKQIDNIKSIIDTIKNKEDVEKFQELKYNLEIKKSNKINDYFNKIVKFLFEMYNDNKKIIIAGYNLNWKNNLNLGKNNNRKFYNIPYRKLVKKLEDKFKEKFILTEESYTSKCDALNLEEIGKREIYSGKRVKRGLFQSQKGLLNADLNGAINIMRKKISIEKVKGKDLMNPIVVRIITPQKIKISRDVGESIKFQNENQRVKSSWATRKSYL